MMQNFEINPNQIDKIKEIEDTNIPIYLLEKALEIQKEGEE